MSPVTRPQSALAIRKGGPDGHLTADGVLDRTTYAALRESLVKAARQEPPAIIVDVASLHVPDSGAWSAFLSARWQISADIPIVLVCPSRLAREAIARDGLSHFVPAYTTDKAAERAVARLRRRKLQRVAVQLPANLGSLRESRQLVRDLLTTWSQEELIPVALVVVNVLVENVLEHTGSEPVVIVESDGVTATVALSDGSSAPAVRLESSGSGIDVSGLAIVAALSRGWGSTPTSAGKTVWAIIGRENQL